MSIIAVRVREIVAASIDISLDRVTDEANFIEDLGADSLDVAHIVMTLEEDFSIGINDLDFPDEQAQKIETVGDAIMFMQILTGSRLPVLRAVRG